MHPLNRNNHLLPIRWKFLTSFAIAIVSTIASTSFGAETETQLPFERLHSHEQSEGFVHAGWSSRYLSEGRDNLDGDSLLTLSTQLGWSHFNSTIWYGVSPDQNYGETQLSIALAEAWGEFEGYLGYTHLEFPSNGPADNEIGAGLSWSGLPKGFMLTGDLYHSFNAQGAFSEIGLMRTFIYRDKLHVTPATTFGMNHGYISDGHSGPNHFGLRLEVDYTISKSWVLTIHGARNWGLSRNNNAPGDAQLQDVFQGGVGLRWGF
jgi:hypothetical protein